MNVTRISYIYGLVDPRTNEVRYVGKSDRPAERFARHLGANEMKARTRKTAWLKQLISMGCAPKMCVLQVVPHACWQECEKQWISLLRSAGAALTNGTSGGDGVDKGTKHTEEARQRISNGLKGRSVSLHTREKLRAANKGRRLSAEHRSQLAASHTLWWSLVDDATRISRLNNLKRSWSAADRARLSLATRGKKQHGRRGTSSYLGVSWFKRDECWRAWITVLSALGRKQLHLGYFEYEKDAASAYDDAASQYFGEYAVLNFPDQQQGVIQ